MYIHHNPACETFTIVFYTQGAIYPYFNIENFGMFPFLIADHNTMILYCKVKAHPPNGLYYCVYTILVIPSQTHSACSTLVCNHIMSTRVCMQECSQCKCTKKVLCAKIKYSTMNYAVQTRHGLLERGYIHKSLTVMC